MRRVWADILTGLYCLHRHNPIRPTQPRSISGRVGLPSNRQELTLTSLQSRLDNASREKMRHLRCICFVRPSPDSIQHLIDEFRDPKYGEYAICEDKVTRKQLSVESNIVLQTLATSSANLLWRD